MRDRRTFMPPTSPTRVFRVEVELSSDQDLSHWGEPDAAWIERKLAEPMASIFHARSIRIVEVSPPWWVRLGTWALGISWHLDHCPHCGKVTGGRLPCAWAVEAVDGAVVNA